jgi:dihydrofolate synthase/folylpolyglutamate synthase
MIASILRQAGHRVGLYTSPHLVDFEERYLINGRVVCTDAWVDAYGAIEPLIADLKLTFFEIGTLIAFELFKREQVDWAVFETGLGGRLDATNVVVPKVSVITSISMDHADFLGNDLLAVAREKLGIVKPGVPLVMAEPRSTDVAEAAREVCFAQRASLEFVPENCAEQVSDAEPGTRFVYRGKRYDLPLQGRYQTQNAICALRACQYAGITDSDALSLGLASTYIPARFQVVELRGKTIVFDVAHNPGAAEALARTLGQRFERKRMCVVVGIMSDKDVRGILGYLGAVAAEFVFTEPDTPRACKAADLPGFLADTNRVPYRVLADVGEAVEQSLAGGAELVCITGSFYTVGEAMQCLGVRPFAERCGERK